MGEPLWLFAIMGFLGNLVGIHLWHLWQESRRDHVPDQLQRAARMLQAAADSSPDPARAVVLRRAAANISVEIERIR